MNSEFQMSMVCELTFFLALQVKQKEDRIFIAETKYALNLLKKFGLKSAKVMRTFLGSMAKITKDEEGVDVDSYCL